MKKCQSLLMTLIMLLSCFAFMTSVSAAETVEPYFELAISEVNGELVVSDKMNNAATVEAGSSGTGDYADHKPIYTTDSANGVNYLQFASAASETTGADSDRINGHSRVGVVFPDTRIVSGTDKTKDSDFTTNDIAAGLTVEVWAKADKTALWNGMFAYGQHNFGGINEFEFRHQSSEFKWTPSIRHGASTSTSFGSSVDYVGKWTHYVITREYDSTSSNFISKLYINGKQYGSNITQSKSNTNTYLSNARGITIGACGKEVAGYGRSFIGGIAEFKVYTSALNEEQIKDAYSTNLSKYYTLVNVTEETLSTSGIIDTEFTITFDGMIDTETLETISVIDNNGNKVKTAFKKYDYDTKTATFTINEYLISCEDYTLLMSDVKDSNGLSVNPVKKTFNVPVDSHSVWSVHKPVYVLEDASGQVVDDISDAKNISISLELSNNSEENRKFVLAMLIYNADGRIKRFIKTDVPVDDKLTISTKDSGIALEPGNKIKYIGWSIEESKGAIPIFVPGVIK